MGQITDPISVFNAVVAVEIYLFSSSITHCRFSSPADSTFAPSGLLTQVFQTFILEESELLVTMSFSGCGCCNFPLFPFAVTIRNVGTKRHINEFPEFQTYCPYLISASIEIENDNQVV